VREEVDATRARVGVRGGGLAGQLLLDLADVAMGEDPVGLDALVDLAELEVRLGSRPAPETPLLASTTTSASRPARASGVRARIVVVA
jgi:hypothetical protein